MKKEILLLLGSIAISILVTIPFGGVVSRYVYPFGGSWIVPEEIIYFTNTFPLFYLFFTPLLYLSFGKNKKWTWTICAILPILILSIVLQADAGSWLASTVFFVVGTILALIIHSLINKRVFERIKAGK